VTLVAVPMDESPRTHYYTLSWWILFLSMGSLIEAMVLIVFIANLADLVGGKLPFREVLSLVLLLLLIVPTGAIALIAPFATKIVLSPQGIEYRTLAYVFRSGWGDLVNVGFRHMGRPGRSLVLKSQKAEVVLRQWAYLLPGDIRRHALRRGIPISWFGSDKGRQLLSDLREMAPHLNV